MPSTWASTSAPVGLPCAGTGGCAGSGTTTLSCKSLCFMALQLQSNHVPTDEAHAPGYQGTRGRGLHAGASYWRGRYVSPFQAFFSTPTHSTTFQLLALELSYGKTSETE